jgi:methyl-accepting chemotaxis protein
MEDGGDKISPQLQRSMFANRLNLLIAVVIGITILLAVLVAVILKKYSGPIPGANAAMTYQGVIAFAVVFLSYGFASVLLIIFFVYRILSPFNRLLKDMDEILTGDIKKRLFLRDKDVFLIRNFVTDVNSLVDKLEQMHLVKDELVCHIDSEGQQVLSLLEKDKGLSSEVREAIISYHEKFIAIIKDKP